MPTLVLKPGREKALLRRHPWIFSGAVARVQGHPGPGETVTVVDAQGRFLAQAAYSPQSQIRARVWTFRQDEVIGPAWFRQRLQNALALRAAALPPDDTGRRLVFAEADGLPGFIADRYGDTVVVQFLSAGAEFWRGTILDALRDLVPAAHYYERSEGEARRLEGLPPRRGPLLGTPPPPERVPIREGGLTFTVDVQHGHKTGFYLDQRPNRALVRAWARDRRVLDVFAYTGGFSVNALAGGAAQVTALDASADALALAAAHVRLNALPADRFTPLEGNAFQVLRAFVQQGRTFDLIVLDPPKFASRAAQVPKAARGYKDINRLAFLLLAPGGVLFTFSCSGALERDLFQKIVADAALDAGRSGHILADLGQGPDHPIPLAYPEARYLKGLLVWVGDGLRAGRADANPPAPPG
ncbi:MAG: methyltransferase domain-containing protein [Chloroflexi bacterium]|nr:methyltransferase domain-containing protein [Chloroflexota bacterium]